jgi:NAD(P)-dependent dehydrogenase (short-subunit alcohol dehydrogenase family)
MIYNMPEEDWDIVLGVHLKGTFNTSRHASGLMKEQKFGRIINVTSSAWLGTIGQANYGAAKGGIVSFTRALALELGRYGVTANCICPLAATRMTMTDEVKEGWKKRLAQGAITQQKYEELLDMPGPEYIPPAAIFLASDAAANVNGAVIGITGGKVAIYSDPVEIRGIYRDWKKDGAWTAQEIIKLAPTSLLVGYVNPAPAEKAK